MRAEAGLDNWSKQRKRFTYDLTALHEVEKVETLSPAGQVIATVRFSDPNGYGTRRTRTVEALDDPAGGIVQRSTETEFDARGMFPLQVTNAEGHEFQYDYDDRFGVLVQTLDPDLIEMRYVYDGFGRRTRTFRNGELRLEETYAQAAATAVAGFIGPEYAIVARHTQASTGEQSVVEVDGLGRMVSSGSTGLKSAGQNTFLRVEREYLPGGPLRKESRPHSANDETQGAATFAYDELNRLTLEHFADNTEIRHSYPSRVNRKGVANLALFNQRQAVFGRHVAKRGPFDTKERESFSVVDHRGNLVAVEDAQRDLDGRGAITDYVYQGFDRPVRVTPVRGESTHTEIHYNPLGQIDYQIDPDVGTVNYTYNGFGETKTVLNDREINTTYRYDLLGRVKEVNAQKGTDPADVTTFIYDVGVGVGAATGKLTHSISPDGVQTAYEYQPNVPGNAAASHGAGKIARIIQTLDNVELESTYNYDEFDRLARIDYPTGVNPMAVKYEYDAQGALAAVKDALNTSAPAYWTLVDSYKGLALKTEMFGNGVEARRNYENLTGRLASLDATRAPAEPGNPVETIQSINYTYHDNGDVETRHDALLHQTRDHFEYDDVHRLTRVWTTDFQNGQEITTRSYAYKRNGNIERKSDVNPFTDYTYDQNHAHAVKTAGPWTFGYDAIGNQTSRTETDGISQTIKYTAFNLPASVTMHTPGDEGVPTITEFKYDAQGERVRKSRPGATTNYHAGIYERSVVSSTTAHKYWIYAGNRKIAQVEHVSEGATTEETTLYLHPDALGSTSAISGVTGVKMNQQFEPFGEREPGTNPAAKKVTAGFTGHEHDDELGFINMRGRVQDPHIGNFLSADPYVSAPGFSQSFNRYSYVVNNPLNYTDPSGFVVNTGCSAFFCNGETGGGNSSFWAVRGWGHGTPTSDRSPFKSPRESWNDDPWYTQTEKQNRDEATAPFGHIVRFDSEMSPEFLAWKKTILNNRAIMATYRKHGHDAAIRMAIKLYGLLPGATYDKDLKDNGETTPDGKVRIGHSAFRSGGFLASTILHEIIHVLQTDADWGTSDAGIAVNELEAYRAELDYAKRFGLSEYELDLVRKGVDQFWGAAGERGRLAFKLGIFELPENDK